jgi:guanidinopropionase
MEREEFIYSGIPTFMGGDFIRENAVKKYNVVFLGVPSDYGASYRLGAKYAPRQLREYSFWDRVDGSVVYDLDNECKIQCNNLKIADLGDVEVNPTNPSQHQKNIARKTKAIRQYAFPLVCGGDHSITYGSFIGCNEALKEQDENIEIGIIHFDAHLDVENQYLSMPEVWHGNVFRKLIENGYLKGSNLYTVGPRGIVNNKWMEFIKEKDINLYTANTVKKHGIEKIISHIIDDGTNKKLKFYISFDIDCIDISSVSGTGTPQYNGLSCIDIEKALRMLKDVDIIGLDIVELNPLIDASKGSFIIACELIFKFLSFSFRK